MTRPADPRERVAGCNWRRTDDGLEIYDEGNPDAWVRMSFVGGVDPAKRLFGVCEECGLTAPQRSLPGDTSTCGHCGAEYENDD